MAFKPSLHDVWKWIRGMHLERFFGDLFSKKDEQGNILLADSVNKGIELAQNLKNWLADPSNDIYISIIPGDWAEKDKQLIINFLGVIIQNLTGIVTIPDVGELFKDYKFSNDFETDKFFHDLALTAANIFADGKATFTELALAVPLFYNYLKTHGTLPSSTDFAVKL